MPDEQLSFIEPFFIQEIIIDGCAGIEPVAPSVYCYTFFRKSFDPITRRTQGVINHRAVCTLAAIRQTIGMTREIVDLTGRVVVANDR